MSERTIVLPFEAVFQGLLVHSHHLDALVHLFHVVLVLEDSWKGRLNDGVRHQCDIENAS